MPPLKLTRREFLSISTLTAVGAALSSCLGRPTYIPRTRYATPSPSPGVTATRLSAAADPTATISPAVAQMVTLPQNLLMSPGMVLEDFEAVGDWTPNAHGTVAADLTTYMTGGQSIRLTDNDTRQCSMERSVNLDMSGGWEKLAVWFYMHDPYGDYGGSNGVHLYLSNDDTYSSAFRKEISIGNLDHNRDLWTCFYVHKTEFETIGGGSWSNPIIRFQLRFGGATPAKTPAISFDSMYARIQGLPAVLLSFDDGFSSQYAECFSFMEPRGMRGTCWAISDDVDQKGYMTRQELQELDRYGWTIGNHCDTGKLLTTLSEADQEAAINKCRMALQSWGLAKGADYLNFPQGGNNADTVTAMTNLGIRLARTARSWTDNGIRLALPFGDLWHIPSNTSMGQTLGTLKGYVDTAIRCGYIATIHLHDVGGEDISVADFRELIDYIYVNAKAGLLNVITIDDLWKLTAGAVRVPMIR